MSMFDRFKRMVRSRLNGAFETTPSSSTGDIATWSHQEPERVGKKPIPSSPVEVLIEGLKTDSSLSRKLADELYNVMTIDDALPWLTNLSRLLEKKTEGGINRLSRNQVADLLREIGRFLGEPNNQSQPEARICVTFDSVTLSFGDVQIDCNKIADCMELSGGILKSTALWWVEIVLLLLPLYKDILPSVTVVASSGSYFLRRKEEAGRCSNS